MIGKRRIPGLWDRLAAEVAEYLAHAMPPTDQETPPESVSRILGPEKHGNITISRA